MTEQITTPEALVDDMVVRDQFGDIGVVKAGCVHFPKTAPIRVASAVRKYGPLTLLHPLPDAPAPSFAITAEHIARQREFSLVTFGPGARTAGVVDHIRRELVEVEAAPDDLSEWADVIILALDGAQRTGADPQAILDAVLAKQVRNESRTWPDWRTQPTDRAIEHDRSDDAPAPSTEDREGERLTRDLWDAEVDACLSDIEEAGHTVAVDEDGTPIECVDECPACAAERLRRLLAARQPAPVDAETPALPPGEPDADLADFIEQRRDRARAKARAALAAARDGEGPPLPDPAGGCVCTWHSEDRGGGYSETVMEYDPACPVHSVHVYDPRAGMWVDRPAAARDGEPAPQPAQPSPCPHCPDGHADPTTLPWGVYVAAERDGDGQPITLHVMPADGAHVAESDAVWARGRLNEPAAPTVTTEQVERLARQRADDVAVARGVEPWSDDSWAHVRHDLIRDEAARLRTAGIEVREP